MVKNKEKFDSVGLLMFTVYLWLLQKSGE